MFFYFKNDNFEIKEYLKSKNIFNQNKNEWYYH